MPNGTAPNENNKSIAPKTVLTIPVVSEIVPIPLTSKTIPPTSANNPKTIAPIPSPISNLFPLWILFIKFLSFKKFWKIIKFLIFFVFFCVFFNYFYQFPIDVIIAIIIGIKTINSGSIIASAILSADFGKLLSIFPVWPFIYVTYFLFL